MPTKKYEYWITEEGITILVAYARNGFTTEEIAKKIGISRNTLNRWRNKYKNIDSALKAGFETSNLLVENSLFKCAVGYNYTEDVLTKDGEIISIEKYQKPSVTAQLSWLNNRVPSRWRNKREITSNSTVQIENNDMDDKVLAQSNKILKSISINNIESNEIILDPSEYELEDIIDD
ncbi:MAG: helix-turn-helix domain containing protein [Sphaerochaetaceae bacterium]|jgi:transposase-like protein|nr:helix-turn-helix domain containing protein [Sphaerochaetaceae bacterium]